MNWVQGSIFALLIGLTAGVVNAGQSLSETVEKLSKIREVSRVVDDSGEFRLDPFNCQQLCQDIGGVYTDMSDIQRPVFRCIANRKTACVSGQSSYGFEFVPELFNH